MFWIEGWVGGVYHIQTFFGFLYLQGPLGWKTLTLNVFHNQMLQLYE